MDSENLFSVSNTVIMPFWLLMFFAPRWKWTARIIRSPLIIFAPAIIYALLVVPQIGGLLRSLSTPSAASIAETLGTVEGTTIAWAHFVAFDLWVGRWVLLDSVRHDINPVLTSVCLFFVLMLGPVGFLMYMLLRTITLSLRREPLGALVSAPH